MTVEFAPLDGEVYLILEELAQVEADEQAEEEIKRLLGEAFPGCGLEKLPLFAVTDGGKTVLEEIFEALAPALREGAEAFLAHRLQRRK